MVELLLNANVLVIDDFQGIRTMLRNIIKDMGVAKIDTASNGEDALNLLRLTRYNVVLCDFDLGLGLNGQQVLEEARRNKYVGLSTIWMIVTAEKTNEMVMGAAEVRPDDYVLKPLNHAMLENRLARLVAKKKALVAIEEKIDTGDHVAAITLCDQRLQEGYAQPQEIHRIKSNLLLTIGAHEGAKAVFEEVLAARDVPWARCGLGKILFYAKDHEGAKAIFEQVLEENRMYMEASDWLARTLEAMGQGEEAQQVLLDAAARSPNSASRQKSLAEVASRNGELDIALKAYEKTMKITEFSPHKNPAVFSGMARVLSDLNAPDAALKLLSQSRKEFRNNPEVIMQTAAIEGTVYYKMGKKAKVEDSLEEVDKLMEQTAGKMSTETAMEMAQAYFKLGQKEKAAELLENVVKNNHENVEIARQVEALFESQNMKEEGLALVEKSREEIVRLNNEGVLLAKAGKLDEGADLLRRSLETLPNNEVIMMNLSSLLLGKMSKTGQDPALAAEVKSLLERVQKLNPVNGKLREHQTMLGRIMG